MNLEGATLSEKLASFDRLQGKSPINPSYIEQDYPEDPMETRQTDARVSPLAALGQRSQPEQKTQVEEQPPVPSLAIADTQAHVDGFNCQLTWEAVKKIKSIVLQACIEALKDRQAMLGPPAETGNAPTMDAGTRSGVHKTKACKICGRPGHNARTCKEKK